MDKEYMNYYEEEVDKPELVVYERIFGGADSVEEALERVRSYSPEQRRKRLETLRKKGEKWIKEATFLVVWEALQKVAKKYGIGSICVLNEYTFSGLPKEEQMLVLEKLLYLLEEERPPEEAEIILDEMCKHQLY